MAMEDTVRVKLTEAGEARKAREIARIRAEIASLEADKDKRVKEFNSDIKTLETEIDRLCSEIREGIEVKAQRELFVSDEVVGGNTGTEFTAVAVAGALTDIAKRAADEAVCSPLSSTMCPIHGTCSCVIESDVAKVDCPLHGADSQHAREVKVQPTDPHDFTAGTVPTECGVCGSGLSDPIHDALGIQAGQAAAQEAAQLEAGKDLGADPSKIAGLDNRAVLGMVADAVEEIAGPAAGDTLRAIGEKVFRSVDDEPPVDAAEILPNTRYPVEPLPAEADGGVQVDAMPPVDEGLHGAPATPSEAQPATDYPSDRSQSLTKNWSRAHAVRTTLGIGAFVCSVAALVGRK